MRTTLYGTFRTNIRDNMTMKKISLTKSWKNVTTCRSSQKPISTTNSLPVICSCATTGLMTALHSGLLEKIIRAGYKNSSGLSLNNKKSITVLQQMLMLALFHFTYIIGVSTTLLTVLM